MSTGRRLIIGIIILSIFIAGVITLLLTWDMKTLADNMRHELASYILQVEETPADAKSKPEHLSLGDQVAEITLASGNDQLETVASDIANKIKGYMDIPYASCKTLADTIVAYKQYCEKNEVEPDRTYIMSVLRDVLEMNDNMQAVWVAFEPNQFDGNDAAFVGKEKIDEGALTVHYGNTKEDGTPAYVSTGVFFPWFYKEDGKILQSITDDWKDEGIDYYTGAMDSQKAYLTDPYTDAGIPISTFTIPLFFKGKAIGVVGVDVPMDELVEMIDKSKPLETGTAMLISADNKFVAHPNKDWIYENDDETKGKVAVKHPINELPGLEDTFQFLEKGDTAVYTSKTILGKKDDAEMQVVHIPVRFGDFPNRWTVVVAVPLSQVMKSKTDAGKAVGDFVAQMKTSSEQTKEKVRKSLFRAYCVGGGVLFVALIVGIFFANSVNGVVAANDYWYQQILNTVHAPISVVDSQKNITFLNTVAANLLGKQPKECIGLPHSRVWGTELDGPLGALQSRGETVSPQFFHDLHWEIYTDFIRNRSGEQQGMIEFFKDVSDRENVFQLVRGVETVVEKTVGQMGQITADSAQLSAASEEQAASLQEITSNMNRMSEQTNQNAGNAQTANQLTNDAVKSAKSGQNRMKEMIESMNQISTNARDTQRVIKTIDDIAFQTNLLALNAAVEAARAGTHGKGFAVVAEEVRNLASRSAKAAKETEELIKKSNTQIDSGVKTANQTSEALNEIAEQVTKATELVAEIAASSQTQAEGVAKINFTLKQVEGVTQQNSQTAVATATVAQLLNGEINDLRGMMSRLRS